MLPCASQALPRRLPKAAEGSRTAIGLSPLCKSRGQGGLGEPPDPTGVTAAAGGGWPAREAWRPPRRSCLPCPPRAWPRDLARHASRSQLRGDPGRTRLHAEDSWSCAYGETCPPLGGGPIPALGQRAWTPRCHRRALHCQGNACSRCRCRARCDTRPHTHAQSCKAMSGMREDPPSCPEQTRGGSSESFPVCGVTAAAMAAGRLAVASPTPQRS